MENMVLICLYSNWDMFRFIFDFRDWEKYILRCIYLFLVRSVKLYFQVTHMEHVNWSYFTKLIHVVIRWKSVRKRNYIYDMESFYFCWCATHVLTYEYDVVMTTSSDKNVLDISIFRTARYAIVLSAIERYELPTLSPGISPLHTLQFHISE